MNDEHHKRARAVERVLTDSAAKEHPGYMSPRRHSLFHSSHLDPACEAFRWANCVRGPDGILRVPKRRMAGVPAAVERLFAVARAEGSGLLVFVDDPRAVAARPSLPTYEPVATHETMRRGGGEPRSQH